MDINQERTLDINFWTAFADLMLALVLVLCLLLFLVIAVISFGTVNLQEVESKQGEMVQLIAKSFGAPQPNVEEKTVTIPINQGGSRFEMQIHNDLDTQKLTFSDQLLFPADDYRLNQNGIEILRTVGKAIQSNPDAIKEIQIQGHADIRRSGRFPSQTGNTELAAMRALEVFKFFQSQDGVGIDPAKSLMSITSFGEFLPVQRDREDASYDATKLIEDNNSAVLMDKNRRIEIVLIYRR